MLLTMVLKLIRPFMTKRARAHLSRLGPRKYSAYAFAQRVLRINARVPWPVHWTSHIGSPERIERAQETDFPGASPGNYIQAINGLKVGKNCWIGPNVSIVSANHDMCDYYRHLPSAPIVIGDNCWLGAGCVILPGVELGNHVVVAANAVVTRPFSSDCVIAGVPARVVKDLPPYGSTGEAARLPQDPPKGKPPEETSGGEGSGR